MKDNNLEEINNIMDVCSRCGAPNCEKCGKNTRLQKLLKEREKINDRKRS